MINKLSILRNQIRKADIPDFILGLKGMNEHTNFIINCIKEEIVSLISDLILSNNKLNQIYELISEHFDRLFEYITLDEGSIIWVYIYNMLCELEKITVEQELFETASNINKFIRISFEIDLNDE